MTSSKKTATVIVLGGPSGTGKTTIGLMLADKLQCPFVEGDSLHPAENINKMGNNIPLTDTDRWPWLTQISRQSVQAAVASTTSHLSVVSCSMLKAIYRDYIKSENPFLQSDDVAVKFVFVFLHCRFEDGLKRVGGRESHFFKADLTKSQYDIMEIPAGDRILGLSPSGSELPIDTTNKKPEVILTEILEKLAYFKALE
ncbi:hypothetical protein BABINDRAFT_5260 [Babjeviella inositovora NRRL Y-12698]|uniref:Gluconokinase n=1 Tax=Babjeviella inositovora NRRL Y-12698 TaxID=984486 RepID=A0A1E3QX75_9ASCO|nr:uncharacterized protein BABINDRAFT_5260 [Babjeviella inositovora NRRL Y-12698]ODQ82266.1 hypothetical protein BABINDRAFT_5260 [Babjeviella inositovora NRRL Y-12698]